MDNYLIYHPKRSKSVLNDGTVAYHDSFGGNEDPYIWNKNFLHTYCHITQIKNVEGQINFWIYGDTFPNFTKLYCDLVFVVSEKVYWKEANHISKDNPMVDNDQAFEHNYKWANEEYKHHQFKSRRRYTLKADEFKSFQPQTENNELIDILPFLNSIGISTNVLSTKMNRKLGSRPYKLDENIAKKLYEFLLNTAPIKLQGNDLKDQHPNRNLISKDLKCGTDNDISESNCGC